MPRWLLGTLVPIALLVGCKEAGGPDGRLAITPDAAELVIGDVQQFTAIGARGAVQWSSSNTQVAAVVAQTGFVTAQGRGQAVITAASGDATASATVNVLAPAALRLSHPTLDFAYPVGSSTFTTTAVTVTNAGDLPISGITVGTIAYGQGQPTGWLTAFANGSTPPVNITVNVNSAGRARGTYTAIVPVQAPNVANSPQNIAVTMAIQAPAGIAFSRDTVAIAALPGETKVETVSVTNSGDAPLTGLSSTITYAPGQSQNWLQASFGANTTAPTPLTLTAATAGLAVGTYTATVRVASTVSGVAPRNVVVRLVVNPGPSIQLSPSPVVANAVVGTNAADQVVNITNGGGGALTGLGLGTITYGAGASNWLTARINAVTAPTSITLTFASAGLAGGTYTATLPVTSLVASNSPVNLPITLTVGPLPVIAVNPGSLVFSDWSGSSVPGQQAVQITNATSTSSIPGLSFQVAYGSGASNWLSGQFQNNVSATPATLLLRPTTTALLAGTYTATVTISTTMPGVAPRTVNVQYTIQSFAANLRSSFSSNCSGCHSAFSGTANAVYSALSPYLSSSHPSYLPCKIFGSCSHSGGKFNSNTSFMNAVNSWISAGAPRGQGN
jgi:hypothetical protein